MSEIRILDGTGPHGAWKAGAGTYEAGLLHLPDGQARGVEDIEALGRADSPVPHRRAGITGGLSAALDATGPLPRPLGLAAVFVGLGLGVLGGTLHAATTLHARFSDGASARIETDPATAAAMMRDWDVVRHAFLRREAPAQRLLAPPAVPALAPPAPEHESAPALTSIFQYEMRKGRLRRLATGKAPDEA